MKLFRLMLLLFLIGLLSFGCAKKSGIEGKVVDGTGQPIYDIKIIAVQVQPIKGYEQFETTTSSDGTFSFESLYPASEYTLKVEEMCGEEKIQSGPEGQISILPSPIEFRYANSTDGVITDSKTGLQWSQVAGPKMEWFRVNDYTNRLKLGGYSDWRLPTIEELKSLSEYAASKGIENSLNDLFNKLCFKNIQSDLYWSSTTDSGHTDVVGGAWTVNMRSGNARYAGTNGSYYVWPVRAGQ